MRGWIGAWLLWICPMVAQAVVLENQTQAITASAQLWWDESGEVTLNDLLLESVVPSWEHNPRGERAFGFRDAAVWMRWPLVRAKSVSAERVLMAEYALLDSVDVYVVDEYGSLLQHERTGRGEPLSEHPIPSRKLAVPLTLPDGASMLYVRVASDSAMKLRMSLMTRNGFASHLETSGLTGGVLFGVLLAGCLIYCVLGAVLRAWALVSIGLYFVMGATWQGMLEGAFALAWPAHLVMPRELIPVLLFTMAGCVHAYIVLARREHGRRMSPVDAAVLAFVLIGAFGSWYLPYTMATKLGMYTNVGVWVMALGLGLMTRELPMETRMPIVASAVLFLLGAVLLALDTEGVLYLGGMSTGLYVATAVPQMFLLTFGVALFAREQVLDRREADLALAEQIELAAEARAQTYAAERRRADDHRLVEESMSAIRSVANSDPLTGLANRAALTNHIRLLNRTGIESLTVAVFDLDHFKRLNDSHGHSVGDEALVLVAKVLQDSCVRPLDFVSRYGGEEFVMLMPNTGLIDAETQVKRVLEGIRNLRLIRGDVRVSISASAGIAREPIQVGDIDFEGLFARADEALYSAKRGGRDRVELSLQPANRLSA